MTKELEPKDVEKKLSKIISRSTINVTKKHIEKGKPQNESECPVALGTKDTLIKVMKDHLTIDSVSVCDSDFNASVTWNNWELNITADIPKQATAFIREVDRELEEGEKKKALKPMKFKFQNVKVEVA